MKNFFLKDNIEAKEIAIDNHYNHIEMAREFSAVDISDFIYAFANTSGDADIALEDMGCDIQCVGECAGMVREMCRSSSVGLLRLNKNGEGTFMQVLTLLAKQSFAKNKKNISKILQ